MKCPKCDGNGFVPTNVFGVNGAIKCDFCNGTGVFITNAVKPMTNEEWLKSMSSEELSLWLAEHIDCAVCPVECHGARTCDDLFYSWLKEKHTE